MRRPIARILILLCALAVLAACSNDDPEAGDPTSDASAQAPEGTSPADYVEGMCTAVSSFQADLEAENEQFQAKFGEETPSPQETKDALATFLEVASDRTQELIDEVDALGTPDVENGEQVRSTFASAFQRVVELFDSAKSDVEALSPDDPAALAAGFGEAATKLQDAGARISSSFEDLSIPELEEAATEAPACRGIV